MQTYRIAFQGITHFSLTKSYFRAILTSKPNGRRLWTTGRRINMLSSTNQSSPNQSSPNQSSPNQSSKNHSSAENTITAIWFMWFDESVPRYGDMMKTRGDLWFKGDSEADTDIRNRFLKDIQDALNNDAAGLSRFGVRGDVALVILLDQFSRACFRGTAQAFAGDAQALRIAQRCYDEPASRGEASQLGIFARQFLFMPFMHSEDIRHLDLCVSLSKELEEECRAAAKAGIEQAEEGLKAMENYHRFALQHRDIIERFGRYPHRNAVFGRESTAEEIEYLQSGSRFGQ